MPQPVPETLSMYGEPSDAEPLDWEWVDDQLRSAGTYWVVPAGEGSPHARPVWGVWTADHRLLLSIGSPRINRDAARGAALTVHLDSGTDVVIVEGVDAGHSRATEAVAAYDEKYNWAYDVDAYGELLVVKPNVVIAWRSAGWAGRDGFQSSGRWRW